MKLLISEENRERIDRSGRKTAIMDLLKELAGIMTPAAERKHLHLRYGTENARAAEICTDVPSVKWLLLELLDNAVNGTPDGGDVILGVREITRDGNTATMEFYVQDDGNGMDPETLAAAKSAVRSSGDDGGVPEKESAGGEAGPAGLMRAGMLTQRLNGNLSCESSRGMGTIFRVLIPVEINDEPRPEPARANSKDLYYFSGKTVLLAEDHPLNQEIAQLMLEKVGFRVKTARNGREAVDAFRADPKGTDLILMDIRMPVMDGIEAARLIRESGEEGRKVPVIALTASAYEGDTKRCLMAGMNRAVLKPIDPQLLYPAIAECLFGREG